MTEVALAASHARKALLPWIRARRIASITSWDTCPVQYTQSESVRRAATSWKIEYWSMKGSQACRDNYNCHHYNYHHDHHPKDYKWSIPWIKSPTPWTPGTSGVQSVTTCVKLITHLQGEVHFRMHLKLAFRYFLMTILRHFAETHTKKSVIFIISADQHLFRLNAILICVYMILLLWLYIRDGELLIGYFMYCLYRQWLQLSYRSWI